MLDERAMRRLEVMAGLRLDPDERRALMADLERMLDRLRVLQELATGDTIPLTPPPRQGDAWREDRVCPSLSQQDVLGPAPEVREGYFAVPPVQEDPEDESW